MVHETRRHTAKFCLGLHNAGFQPYGMTETRSHIIERVPVTWWLGGGITPMTEKRTTCVMPHPQMLTSPRVMPPNLKYCI